MKKISILVILMCAVYVVDKLPALEMKKIPHSQPTPVEVFMDKIAAIESGGNYKVTNEFGMMGRYQFSPGTVRALGFNVNRNQFLNNPELQDSVMYRYMKANQTELLPLINKYDGKTIRGVKVTRAGILAGAHFAGSYGVYAYFRNGGPDISDARGTSLTKYMKFFSNVQLPEL